MSKEIKGLILIFVMALTCFVPFVIAWKISAWLFVPALLTCGMAVAIQWLMIKELLE